MAAEDDVARGLPPEVKALLLQHFQNVAVPHLGPVEGEAPLPEGHLEAHVAHDRAHHPGLAEGQSGEVEDVVPVEKPPLAVNELDPVPVAVKGDAQVQP